ncbi:MAG: serpin family protein [Dermatophilaceae bacterium]
MSVTRRTLVHAIAFAGPLALAATTLSGCRDAGASATPTGRSEVITAKVARATAPESAAGPAAAAMREFGTDLIRRLLAGHGDNLACSPFSVATALGMTANGAAGRTATEMLDVLGADSLDALDQGLAALTTVVESCAGTFIDAVEKPYTIALDSANSLWPQAGITWKQPFLDAIARWFGAGLHTVDYIKASEAARVAINAWTSTQTHAKIPQLIPADALDSSTRLVLVNALYLKAPWLLPFAAELTTPGPFQAASGNVTVPMMRQTESMPYAAGPGWAAVTLFYAGRTLAMTLIRTEQASAADHAKWLTTANLDRALATEESTQVALTMPRWTFRVPSSLPPYLTAMGMPNAFGDAADFSAMTDQEALFISDVVHEVYVSVDEKGTEAAAATAVAMAMSGAYGDPETLTLDRPFLFVIHEVSTHAPLFIGRVADPSGR